MLNCLNPIIKIPLEKLETLKIHNIKLKQYQHFNDLTNKEKNYLAKLNVLKRCDFYACKTCNLCLNYKRYDWTLRALNEWKNWQNHYFITLTFDNEHYNNFWFEPRFFSKWVKTKLKKNIGECKYLASQEFGEKTFRKHYHLILFTNYIFSDIEPIKKSKRNNIIYTSKKLNELWKYGSINQINLISSTAEIKYVCSYSVKELKNSKSNWRIPPNYQGEKLIISRGFGDKLNLDSNLEMIPKTIIKNSCQRIYIANRKFKRKEIDKEELYQKIKIEEPYQKIKKQIKKDSWSLEAYNQLLTKQLAVISNKKTKHKTEI